MKLTSGRILPHLVSTLALLVSSACSPEHTSAPPSQRAELAEEPMPQQLKLGVDGLWTNTAEVGKAAPPGALSRADNLIIDAPGRARPVRGMVPQNYWLPDGAFIRSFFDYESERYVTTGTQVYRDSGSGYSAVVNGNRTPPSGAMVNRTVTASGSLYLASASGLWEMAAPGGDLQRPGLPRALDIRTAATMYDPLKVAWLTDNKEVGYRVVIGKLDANGDPVLGAPSGRYIHSFISGGGSVTTGYVVATVPLPPGLNTNNFVQLYRTTTVDAGVGPGDSMALVAEVPLTSGALAAGEVLIEDFQPDALRGAPLYTNAALGGMEQANFKPPLGVDIATFRDCLFAANTTYRQRLTIRFLGVPDDGDVLTINGLAYTATTNDVMTDGEFQVHPNEATVSLSVERTAQDFVYWFNKHPLNTTLRAYYASGENDAPGIVLIESLEVVAGFSAQASANGSRYEPDLSVVRYASASPRPNRLHYSKQGLPYAFPLGNYLSVGAQEKPIVRILALRDSLFIFKKGDGLWQLTGAGPGSFYLRQVNQTLSLAAPESAVVVDNTIYALSTAGVVAISEAGVQAIDLPVANVFRDRILRLPTSVYQRAFGVASEEELKYILYLPDGADDAEVSAAEGYIYNIATNTWTRRVDGPVTTGAVRSDGKLWLGSATAGEYGEHRALVERRTGSNEDYLGKLYFAVIPQSSGLTSDGRTWFRVSGYEDLEGRAIRGVDGVFARVVRVADGDPDLGYNYAEMDSRLDLGSSPTPLQVYEPIPIGIGWHVNDAGNPSAQKQFTEATLLFAQNQRGRWDWKFANDLAPTTWLPVAGTSNATPYSRVWVPSGAQRTTRLYTQIERDVAGEVLDIIGLQATVRTYASTASANRLAR